MISVESLKDEALVKLFEEAPFSLRCDLAPAKSDLVSRAQESIQKSSLCEQLQGTSKALLEATIFLAWDCIDESHEIVQDMPDETASLIHCLIHRIEGDLPNCAYWYRRCEFHELNKALLSILLNLNANLDLGDMEKLNHAQYGSLEMTLGSTALEYRKREILSLIEYILTLK